MGLVKKHFEDWQPKPARSTGRRKPNGGVMLAEIQNEAIVLSDLHGRVRFPLGDLPGKLITYMMLVGAMCLLRKEPDKRACWLAWRHGLMPKHLRPAQPKKVRPPPPPKPPKPLSDGRKAIVETLQAMPGCRATIEQTEALVRQLTANQIQLCWCGRPPAASTCQNKVV